MIFKESFTVFNKSLYHLSRWSCEGERIYTTPQGGNYLYTDSANPAVRQFYADMTADIVRNYPQLDGVQYDDHFSMPPGFNSVDGLPQATR